MQYLDEDEFRAVVERDDGGHTRSSKENRSAAASAARARSSASSNTRRESDALPVTFIVFFYASWATECVTLSPLFAQLSLKYVGDTAHQTRLLR